MAGTPKVPGQMGNSSFTVYHTYATPKHTLTPSPISHNGRIASAAFARGEPEPSPNMPTSKRTARTMSVCMAYLAMQPPFAKMVLPVIHQPSMTKH